jgi:hypothetical protein
MRFERKAVFVGQVSHDIGVRFTTKTWPPVTHKIDPDSCSKRPSVAMLASNVRAAEPPLPLADLPVVDMKLIDPLEYRPASDLAASGSAPLDIALKIVGEFEGPTQHIIQVNEGAKEMREIKSGKSDIMRHIRPPLF